MSSISECDSNAENEDDGYMSDPTHLGNSNEHQKLYKVAPNLKEGFDVPLRD